MHSLLSISVFVALAFLPATVLLYFAWSVRIGNKRPDIAGWRLSTFRWGLICAPISMAALVPGEVNYLETWGTPNWVLGVMNWVGFLLWIFSLAASLTGKGRARVLLCGWGVLAILGTLAVYLTYP